MEIVFENSSWAVSVSESRWLTSRPTVPPSHRLTSVQQPVTPWMFASINSKEETPKFYLPADFSKASKINATHLLFPARPGGTSRVRLINFPNSYRKKTRQKTRGSLFFSLIFSVDTPWKPNTKINTISLK